MQRYYTPSSRDVFPARATEPMKKTTSNTLAIEAPKPVSYYPFQKKSSFLNTFFNVCHAGSIFNHSYSIRHGGVIGALISCFESSDIWCRHPEAQYWIRLGTEWVRKHKKWRYIRPDNKILIQISTP